MFEKFTVIDLIKTRSASVCTFTGNVVKFNIQTAQELHFPEYIQFLIEPKSKQFAIRACKEDAPNAIAFSNEQALVYDLGAAFRPSPRGGWTAKRQKEAAAAAALTGTSQNEEVNN